MKWTKWFLWKRCLLISQPESNNKSLDWAGDQTHTADHAVRSGNARTWPSSPHFYDGWDASILFRCSQAQLYSLWSFLQLFAYLAPIWSWTTVSSRITNSSSHGRILHHVDEARQGPKWHNWRLESTTRLPSSALHAWMANACLLIFLTWLSHINLSWPLRS